MIRLPCCLLLSLCPLIGCGRGGGDADKRIESYPVTGKVLDRAGKPLTRGAIEFRPVGKSEGSSRGEIQSDGSFKLDMMTSRGKQPGAPEGEHEVSVMVDSKGVTPPVTLLKKYKVTAGENDITVKLE